MHIENINVLKLFGEFNNVGIYPYPVFDKEDGSGDFTFADGTDMNLVQTIIDAHDPTPIPPAPTIKDQIMANTDYLLDVDFRLILVELGMI